MSEDDEMPVRIGEEVEHTVYTADESGHLTVPHSHTGKVRKTWWTDTTVGNSRSGDSAPGWKARIWCTSCPKPHQHTTPTLPARALAQEEVSS